MWNTLQVDRPIGLIVTHWECFFGSILLHNQPKRIHRKMEKIKMPDLSEVRFVETKKTSSKCSTQNLQNYLEKTSLKTKPLEDKLVLHISSEAFHLISWELGKLSLHESFKYNGAWWKLTGPTCPRQWEDKPLVTGNRVKHPEFLLRPFARHSIGTKAQCSWLLITIW